MIIVHKSFPNRLCVVRLLCFLLLMATINLAFWIPLIIVKFLKKRKMRKVSAKQWKTLYYKIFQKFYQMLMSSTSHSYKINVSILEAEVRILTCSLRRQILFINPNSPWLLTAWKVLSPWIKCIIVKWNCDLKFPLRLEAVLHFLNLCSAW